MLVYNNDIRITDKEELIVIDNGSPRPRSAIGHTAGGIVMLVAVQGDNFVSGYAGLSLPELASMMKDLGCSFAMNLDGGGSTSMLVGGAQTVKPSATGVERPVVSVLMIRKK
jgi:exopolysaccharide biosynthesis protein